MGGCKDDPVIVDPDKSMKDLVVPGGFGFGMVKTVPVSVRLPTTVDYASSKMIIEFWDENSNNRPGKMMKTAAAGNDGIYTGTVEMVKTARRIFAHCFAGWRSVNLSDSTAKNPQGAWFFDFRSGCGSTLPQFCQTNHTKTTDAAMSGKDFPRAVVINAVANGDFLIHEFGKMDNWWDPMNADSTWYATDGAQNFTSFVSEEGHSFARIQNNNMITGSLTQLVVAKEGQIVSFTADIRGFDSQQDTRIFLLPRNASGSNFEIYSYNLVNMGVEWTNATVAAKMPKGTESCQVLFNMRATGIVDFDNAIVTVNDSDSDPDNDGVLSWEDNTPDDGARVLDDYYPGKGKPGTFAFEDSWPLQTDYDFNDVVVDYQYRRVCNNLNQVVEFDLICQVRAVGSSNKNGFGFQLNIPPDLVMHVESDFGPPGDGIRVNANGTEAGQDKATFIVFGDAVKAFPKTQVGSPTVNTTLGYYFVVPTEYIYRVILTGPLDQELISNSSINPFIFRTADRGHEIHLPGYPATSLADRSRFGTADDATSEASGEWYVTRNGLPWALNVPVYFDYPTEGADLVTGHLKFMDWAAGSGARYLNWYLDEDGYRNWEHIYRW